MNRDGILIGGILVGGILVGGILVGKFLFAEVLKKCALGAILYITIS
jgi:hypothetical protein